MLSMSVDATFHGKELSALEKIIAQRSEFLGENTKDAAVATAITAIKSLKAETKVANPRNVVFEFYRSTVADAVWRKRGTAETSSAPGQKGMYRRAIVVMGRSVRKKGFVNLAGRYTVGETVGVWNYVPLIKIKRRRINRDRNTYIIAKSEADALKWAKDESLKNVQLFKGIAKNIWNPIMRALAENEPTAQPMNVIASEVIARNQSATQTVADNTLTIEVENNLRYATLALKSGPTGVSLALQKAANKIAGQLKKTYEDTYFFFDLNKKPKTPFPEIVRKRK